MLLMYCSVGQLEELLLDGGAFIFYGMERFLAYLPPHKAVALNLVGMFAVTLNALHFNQSVNFTNQKLNS